MKIEKKREVEAIKMIDSFGPDIFPEEVGKYIKYSPAILEHDYLVANYDGQHNLKNVPDDLIRYIKGLLKDKSLKDTVEKVREKTNIQILDYSKSEFKNDYSIASVFRDMDAFYGEDENKSKVFRALLFNALDTIIEEEAIERVGIPVVLSRLCYDRNEYNERIISACIAYQPVNNLADMFWCDNSSSVLIRVDKNINRKTFTAIWETLEDVVRGKNAHIKDDYVTARMSFLKEKGYSLEDISGTYHPEYLIEDSYGMNRKKNGKHNTGEKLLYFENKRNK